MPDHSRSLVLVDGECGFCRRAVDVALSGWMRAQVDAAPLQSVDLGALGLSVDKCLETLHVVAGESVFTGSDAVAAVLQRSRGAWPMLGRVLMAPGVRWLAQRGYGLVARNRHRLPGGSDTCRL